jgi:hypothetical protein
MNWRSETVHPVKRVAFEGTFFYAFWGPARDSKRLRGTCHADIASLACELLLNGFQAILLTISNVHRVLLAATLPGPRKAGWSHEFVLSKQSSDSDWNSI